MRSSASTPTSRSASCSSEEPRIADLFYVDAAGQQQGPVTDQQLRQLVQRGPRPGHPGRRWPVAPGRIVIEKLKQLAAYLVSYIDPAHSRGRKGQEPAVS